MARIMVSMRGTESGDAAIIDFPETIPPEIGMSILFTEIAMARCPHMTEAVLTDGRTYCCDCGKILTVGEI